jgi:hypothetical protein
MITYNQFLSTFDKSGAKPYLSTFDKSGAKPYLSTFVKSGAKPFFYFYPLLIKVEFIL